MKPAQTTRGLFYGGRPGRGSGQGCGTGRWDRVPTPPGRRAPRRAGRVAALTVATCAVFGGGAGLLTQGPQAVMAAPRCDHVAKDQRPELREGAQGEAVAQVQCLVNTRSAHPGDLPEDGVFGADTAAAVRWVQECSGLEPSGVTDEATWKRLYRAKSGCGKKNEVRDPAGAPGASPGAGEQAGTPPSEGGSG